jgi:LuxR family transcriptional regulator, maltose regulon positive regulatory protein
MNSTDNPGDLSLAQQVGEANATPILLTKLHRPGISPGLERRTSLLERLDRNYHRPLTLISAPAGYGKTTLASMWLQASDCVSAWVSLDERDDDLLTFATYLITAIGGLFPHLQFKTQALLQAPAEPSASTVARYLMNDLHQITEPFILALDDIYMVKQQVIFDLLSELLRHPLPSMHLVLIGRRDPPLPIASLRARGQVTEIRARDLQFTPAETAHLLGQMLDRDIGDEIAAEWTEKTEGWVTALRLAALSLHHRDRTDDLRTGIPGRTLHLKEYLLADVLAHLPPAKKDWLLRVSLLDRFCAPLCEVICVPPRDGSQSDSATATTDLTGQEFVRWLHDDNLFLVTLDDQGQWFRFHHLFQALLQDLLQEQLTPGEIAEVHLRASAWCAENGLVDEAIQHALTAKDTPVAVELVVRNRYALMAAEQWRRLDRWLKLLPAEAAAQSALLSNARALLAMQRGEEKVLLASQRQAELLLATIPAEAEEHKIVEAELAVLHAVRDYYSGQATCAIVNARRGLDLLPPQALHVRAMAMAVIVTSLQMRGDLEQGVRIMREALADPCWPTGLRARLLHFLSEAYMMDGDLSGVLETGSECLRIAEGLRLLMSVSYGRYNMGTGHYLRNELDLAEPYLLTLLEERASSAPVYVAFGVFALALIYQAQGRESEATQVVETISVYLQETEHSVALAIAAAFRVELAIRQGKLAEAFRLSRRLNFDIRPPRWYFYVPQLTQCKLLLAEGTPGSLAGARSHLAALDAEMCTLNRNHVRIDVLALQALVDSVQGEEATALEKLGSALELAERGGFVRNFVDLGPPMANLLARLRRRHEVAHSTMLPYLDRILAAFPTEAQVSPEMESSRWFSGPLRSPTSLAEPLTERESHILTLLATDLLPEEMAGRMYVSVATVRTHIRNIYAKLAVHSRFEAVQRARELGLLGP